MRSGQLRIHVFGITLGVGLLFAVAAAASVRSLDLKPLVRGLFTPRKVAFLTSLRRDLSSRSIFTTDNREATVFCSLESPK